MQVAPLPENEQERLKALFDYDILDTESEKVFDDLALLASQICNTPIALISLIDPNRQWFKSAIGLNAKETPRDYAFCAHAIHQQAIFEVEDTIQDPRFADNPLVTEQPNIRFYAGTPLITPEGYAIGTLCAIDRKPGKLNDYQTKALEILGRNVVSQMELRRKIKQLKEQDKNKTEFLSNMSHELRTPLNAIINFSQLLLNDENTLDNNKLRQYLQHIDYSGKRLLSVINNVLDLNKIEAGMMTLDIGPCTVRKLIEQVIGMLALSAQQKHIHLNSYFASDIPEVLMLDETKFSQIVINLISNAIKYTPNDKKILVSLNRNAETFTLSVQDEGVGISEADQSKLFNSFQQVGRSKSTQGSGLGLVITKNLVELMGGKINVHSEPLLGSKFTVELPINLPTSEVAETTTKRPALRFNPLSRVLVVEDNEINQIVIEVMLETLNLKTTLASTGEEALQKVLEDDFDLILMDIHLPGINGIDASLQIRKQKPQIPIVALSADTFEQERTKKSPSVFDAFLTKPLEQEKLVEVLSAFLRQS